MSLSEIMVRVTRGPITESIHRGHAAVVTREGTLLYGLGDPGFVTFARSTAKLIQALPVMESGAADRFRLTEREIALLCASHNGEAEHVETAAAILQKIGLPETCLQCGAHDPFHKPTAKAMRQRGEAPTALHNNCSGKHSGMLALAVHLNVSVDDYLSPSHPVQRLMLQAVGEMSGMPADKIHLGVDGCGVPVFGMGIDKLAAAYARLGSPEGLPEARQAACKRILDAITKYPHYIAGSDRFDTRLIAATQGRIIGKMGAEGLFAVTVPEKGWGIVVKVEDGAQRALYPAVTELLNQLGLLNEAEVNELASFHTPSIKNWQGTWVGTIRPDFQLRSFPSDGRL